MSKPNKYQEQMSHAVEATRQELLKQLQDAQAARNTALIARDHAAHDKWSAYKQMGNNEEVLAVASRIEDLSARTQLLGRNLTLFANDSQSGAEDVQAAMSTAATAIKTAAEAMELLNMEIHGVAAVTNTQNKGNAVETEALAANEAVKAAVEAGNDLQRQSIKCSIVAATPLAGSVAQIFSVLGDQITDLLTGTTQARDAARQEVAATTTNRNVTWKRFFTTIPPFERPLQEKQSLLTSLQEIDTLANYDLTVRVSNQPPAKDPGPESEVDQAGLVAGLHVQVILPENASPLYAAPCFYAVEESETGTFQCPKESPDAQGAGAATPPAGTAFSATLTLDHRGVPLAFGKTYCVFMAQTLKPHSLPAPGQKALSARASLPSQPVLATYSSQKLSAPKVLRLHCGLSHGPCEPLLVAFTLPKPPPASVSYRMILIPSMLWEKQQADEQFLIERASPSDYAPLVFKALPLNNEGHARDASLIADQISERFLTDLNLLNPTLSNAARLESQQAARAAIVTLLQEPGMTDLSRTALVYYSPENSPPPADTKAAPPVFTFGYYNDMSGDIIDLSNDCYTAGVLAVPANINTTHVSALAGESEPVGAPTPYYGGSGPVAPPVTAAPATPTAAA